MVGSALGLATAYFSYRQYYPSLASKQAHRPYGPRISDDEDGDELRPYLDRDADPERAALFRVEPGGSYRDSDDEGGADGALPRSSANGP